MAYVYVLGDYEEHGTKNAAATLERARLPQLLEAYISAVKAEAAAHNDPHFKKTLAPPVSYETEWKEYRVGLQRLLERSDVDLCSEGGCDLGKEWGGLQLLVIELT